MRHTACLLLLAAIPVAGCGRSALDDLDDLDELEVPLDGGKDAHADAHADADAGQDATADAGEDAPLEATADVAIDVPSSDVTVDVARDVAFDVAVDVPPADVATDPVIDVAHDVATDPVIDVQPDAPRDTGRDALDFFDAFPIPDSGPIADCAECAQQSCDTQINACYNDPSCVGGVTCAFTSCFGGGAPSFQCLLGCFGGDFGAALKAVSAFRCVAQSCGQTCAGAFGGGGGGFPGGGGPGGGGFPGGGGPGGMPAAAPVLELPADFPWPAGTTPERTLVVPPPAAFDAFPGMVPACGVWARPACE